MQASCPKCAHKVVIDDAKAPDRAFSVKCPKCQTPVRFPAKGAAVPAAVPAAAPEPFASAAPAAAGGEEMREGMMAQLRREMGVGGAGAGARALVAVADPGLALALGQVIGRLGYAVDTVDDVAEAARLLEQGLFALVATTRAAAGGQETVLQRMSRLNPEGRRGIFLLLVGDEFKTGDGTQAFAVMADLVVAPRDLAGAEAVLRNTIAERTRLYQLFNDARARFEASAG